MTKLICCFCEKVYSSETKFCGFCNEYKGLMTINEFDNYYDVSKTIFKETPQLFYKHLSGEYNTASSFGFWVASNIVKNQTIPNVIRMNSIEKAQYKKVLLYNQYNGKDHSLILISQC